jgi:hypothetical protein
VAVEVLEQPPTAEIRTGTVAVEIERGADPGGSEPIDEPFRLHSVTMLMPMKGSVAALAVLVAAVLASSARAAPPQGFQSNASFAASYAARGVAGVSATTQRVSCYAPQVFYLAGLRPDQGYPDGGGTACPGATTGEELGPFPTQDRANPPLLVKDHSESDIHVDPANPRHLIGVSKWVVNGEGYNHLTGFFESFDAGVTWPQQGHVPGFEGWTDNSDPVGAFDPWGNFYTVLLPYMFDYTSNGNHRFLSSAVNPALARSGIGVAVRPHGAATANAWLTRRAGRPDLVAPAPFRGAEVFDKQWIAIDTNRRSRFFGRVYVAWSIGSSDESLRIYESHATARPNGTHTNWTTPRLVLRQVPGIGENGPLPRVAPDGRVWLAVTSFIQEGRPFTISVTSSTNGGSTWTARRFVRRGQRVYGYANTTFRAAFGLAFEVGKRKVGRAYPLYAVYEDATSRGTELFLTASFDNGRHWRPRIQVNDNQSAGEALQPGIATAPNGRVAVAFYDRRLPCPPRGSAEVEQAGLAFDPRAPYGRINYCINSAVQFYGAGLRPLGQNVRMSAQTWDPQLSAPHPGCICSGGTFIGDYFGVDSRGGFTYTAAVTTANAADENPGFHQQQLVSKLRTP